MRKPPPFAAWITGIPASGKSTLAAHVGKKLEAENIPCQILESDEMRKILTPEPEYTPRERENFYFALVEIGKMFLKHGITIIFDATAHQRKFRDKARREIENFMEIYRMCSVELASSRDPKGLYKKAISGEAFTLPGLQSDYEPPENPEILIQPDTRDFKAEAERIYQKALELFS